MKTTRSALLALLLISSSFSFAATLADYQDALASQIADTASATNLNRRAKANLIGSTVKTTIATAIQGMKDWDAVVKTAAALGTTAAKTVPSYTEEIIAAIADVPRIAATDGLGEAIAAAIRGQLPSAEAETAQASPSNSRREPIREFSSSRAEAVVSPSGIKPTPTPKPTDVTIKG